MFFRMWLMVLWFL